MNLSKLFRPKKLAIIGGYWADFVFDENIKIGFKGKILHINPKRSSSKKKKYYIHTYYIQHYKTPDEEQTFVLHKISFIYVTPTKHGYMD